MRRRQIQHSIEVRRNTICKYFRKRGNYFSKLSESNRKDKKVDGKRFRSAKLARMFSDRIISRLTCQPCCCPEDF